MDRIARTLSTWVQSVRHTLQEIEEQVIRLTHALGNALLTGLGHLVDQHPAPDVPCPCGNQARYVRMRPATINTLLGSITYEWAYYQCATCRHGQVTNDGRMQVCAGGRVCQVE